MSTFIDLSLFARTLNGLGITPPQDFTAALDLLSAGMEAATASAEQALLAKFDAGTLTPKNIGAEVRSAALDIACRQYARELVRGIEPAACKAAAAAVRADGDRLIHDLRVIFDRAAEAMAVAAELFDPTAPAEAVLGLGPAAAQAWNALAENAATLDAVNAARVPMALDFGYGRAAHRSAWFITGITTPAQLAAAEAGYAATGTGLGGRWHALAAAGVELHLNTAEQTAAVEAAVAADTARAAAVPTPLSPAQQQQQDRGKRELRLREQQLAAVGRRR